MQNRPKISPELKLQLRQESGFGCCFCGHPWIVFHHIIPWHVEEHFRAEDMMALCENCHRQCTNGNWDEEMQRSKKHCPFNIERGLHKGTLHWPVRELKIQVGGGWAIDTPNLLRIDRKPIISARLSDNGIVLFSALIQNEAGETIAILEDNEWSFFTDDVWDFETSGKQTKVRLAPRNIAFKISHHDNIIRVSGRWFVGGQELRFSDHSVALGIHSIVAMNVTRCESLIDIFTRPTSIFGSSAPPPIGWKIGSAPNEVLIAEWEARGRSAADIDGLWLWDQLVNKRNVHIEVHDPGHWPDLAAKGCPLPVKTV